jgi:hypothetical protein
MNENINISFDIIQEFDKILWIVSELTIAQEKAINSLDLVRTGDLYEGKAKEEMISFYITSSNHIVSLINLYSKAYQYALNAIINMIEQDKKVAKIIQEVTPW